MAKRRNTTLKIKEHMMRGFGWLVLLLVLVGVVNQMALAVPGVMATGNPAVLTPAPNERGGTYLETTLVSVSDTEGQGDGASQRGRISADGAWVAFSSVANNLTMGGQVQRKISFCATLKPG
jgi:hypothetical protein